MSEADFSSADGVYVFTGASKLSNNPPNSSTASSFVLKTLSRPTSNSSPTPPRLLLGIVSHASPTPPLSKVPDSSSQGNEPELVEPSLLPFVSSSSPPLLPPPFSLPSFAVQTPRNPSTTSSTTWEEKGKVLELRRIWSPSRSSTMSRRRVWRRARTR